MPPHTTAKTPTAARSPRERTSDRAPAKTKRHRATAPEEFKTAMLNIRVKDELKREATATLAEIGISLPEAIRVFLGRIVSARAFPFELELPNDETMEAIRESRASRGVRYTSAEEMFDALEKGRS